MSTVNPPSVFFIPEWRYCACVCVRAGYFPPPLNPLQMGVCGVGVGEGVGFGGVQSVISHQALRRAQPCKIDDTLRKKQKMCRLREPAYET